jgi:SAM-dependent methyltransferase
MTSERVSDCPLCGHFGSHIVHAQVPDFVFGATDERWDIARCGACGSLYLPLRPDRGAIGTYYTRYYTHAGPTAAAPISGIHLRSSLLKRMADGWRNARYGTARTGGLASGALLVPLFWPLRQWLMAECRHLPRPTARPPDFRVLDVGFGDGRFLSFAAETGATAVGCEIDPQAVADARQRGLDVFQGDIEGALARFGPSSFDYLTMSHVIEHVHDPRGVLAAAAALLRPGGALWMELPNPGSLGHRRYGPRWRDLDPPRHLCLPTLGALQRAAAAAGLALDRRYHRPFVAFEVFPFSAAAAGLRPRRWAQFMLCLRSELAALVQPATEEWLTLRWRRGSADRY